MATPQWTVALLAEASKEGERRWLDEHAAQFLQACAFRASKGFRNARFQFCIQDDYMVIPFDNRNENVRSHFRVSTLGYAQRLMARDQPLTDVAMAKGLRANLNGAW